MEEERGWREEVGRRWGKRREEGDGRGGGEREADVATDVQCF